jgi:fumarylacetoacetate (FAA) hydrolase family protein
LILNWNEATDFMIDNDESGVFIGRVWRNTAQGPAVVTVRQQMVVDITSRAAPTMRDLLEMDDPVSFVRSAGGEPICNVDELLTRARDGDRHHLLAPMDLQAVKACGVTFARSMVERVIEERAAGNPAVAARMRERISKSIGSGLQNVRPGSPEATQIKAALIVEGLWSQYLEVGIGPDAEVFTKAQPMSSVGYGADIGLHPLSKWNNPEPEIVLAIDSKGRVKGVSLGNDVNLRDIEGRSALLLGKSKDNNASCSVGPFIRLLDENYSLDDVRNAYLELKVVGEDGFVLNGNSSMREISRDPLDLVAQTIGPNHQYPDGLVLFLGTMFAPIEDRDTKGHGFTHKLGDIVTIYNQKLGALSNRVALCTECPPWEFGVSHLMRNLASRDFL